MTPWMMVRSILCTPALSLSRLNKGLESGADLTFLDLEDGVPEAQVAAARERVITHILKRKGDHLLGLRINSLDSRTGMIDLLQLLEFGAQPDILFFPKLTTPDELVVADRLLKSEGWDTRFCPIIETPEGLQNVKAIANATPRNVALIFGAADFSADMGIELNWENLLFARHQLCLAAAAANLALYDAPTFVMEDLEAIARESRLAKRMGFSGKAVLHPSHVETVNQLFLPDSKRVEQARRVIAAHEMAGDNICTTDGQIVGPPFYKQAQQILKRASQAEQEEALS